MSWDGFLIYLICIQANQFIGARVPFQSEDHFSLHWPCPMIIFLPFCHRSKRLLYALKILQKLISLLASILLLDCFVDPSHLLTALVGLLMGPLVFQLASIGINFLSSVSYWSVDAAWTTMPVQYLQLVCLKKQQEIILRFRAGWKGLRRLNLYVWKSCCQIGSVRKWVQRITLILYPNRAMQRHPTVNCRSWFDLNSTKP